MVVVIAVFVVYQGLEALLAATFGFVPRQDTSIAGLLRRVRSDV